MLSIISKNGEDELMLQDIPNYKLSQNYIWYGEFDVNIDGKTYHFTGSMKYTPNETFWLELLVSPDCDLTDKFMNNPFLLSGKEIIIKGVVSEAFESKLEYATVYCSFNNQNWGSNLSKTQSLGETIIPEVRLNKLIFKVNICLFHNNSCFKDDEIKCVQCKFNEAFDDLFYEMDLLGKRNKSVTLCNKEVKISENKVLHIAECFNSFLENNDSLIKNNFYSDDKELLQVCAKSVENILNKSKSKISRIDKSTQNIIPFMSYVNGTLLEVFKDIQIISDYFRLVSWNYTLCAEEVIVTTKYSDTPFSILYCLPFLEIKKYEVNINNLPTYVQRNKVFLKNDNYLLPIKNFFENYSNLGNCIFLLNENHYSRRFTSLYLGRTIDALAAIARYKQINKSEKYQKVLNLFFESYPNIIKKIDKILENVKCSDLQENDTKDIIRGKKISTLRTQIVHFDFSKDKHLPNIEKVIKLMEIFECLICDFIFEIINVDEEVRSSLLKQQENLCLSHRL